MWPFNFLSKVKTPKIDHDVANEPKIGDAIMTNDKKWVTVKTAPANGMLIVDIDGYRMVSLIWWQEQVKNNCFVVIGQANENKT